MSNGAGYRLPSPPVAKIELKIKQMIFSATFFSTPIPIGRRAILVGPSKPDNPLFPPPPFTNKTQKFFERLLNSPLLPSNDPPASNPFLGERVQAGAAVICCPHLAGGLFSHFSEMVSGLRFFFSLFSSRWLLVGPSLSLSSLSLSLSSLKLLPSTMVFVSFTIGLGPVVVATKLTDESLVYETTMLNRTQYFTITLDRIMAKKRLVHMSF